MKITIMWKDQIASEADFDGITAKIKIYDPVGMHHLFPREELDAYLFLKILEQRCPDRNRANIDKLLNHWGLEHYDVLGILRKTHGLKYDDFVWVKFDGETISYEDIKIRE